MIVHALIAGSVVAALALARRKPVTREPRGSRASWWRSPEAALALVTCLIYANQVLFTVYILSVRGGDVSFVARHLPDGWFSLARGPAMQALAASFPLPELLAPTVLRVQAFLELPFVVFAYLSVCRWFSPGVYARALRLAWPASAAYTAIFCLVEWQLFHPYTVQDVIIRVVAAAVVPLWAARLTREGWARATGLSGLLLFALSTAALGALVLVVYDTALLYNLGHLGAQAIPGMAALVVLAAVRYGARSFPWRPPGHRVDAVGHSFGWFLVLFFVPALPIRYGLSLGAPHAAAGGAVLVVLVALVYGLRDVFAQATGRPVVWLSQLAVACAAGVGGVAAVTQAATPPAGHPEARLLWAAAAFFVCLVGVCGLFDRLSAEERT
ncbi:hypothetical protein E1292_20600 [Nonomuraea deserti]|uniref:Uncharacterized protein n=1 Tax=Nonomuraea deserti TaxID=1848322 RepID=A0A4R4VIU1_9ACTN|nr:hypothetical protein [Nonomuraea deserti]TDD03717.1 hypothetical protein E1292_20600 [Nonomuraea deserti]